MKILVLFVLFSMVSVGAWSDEPLRILSIGDSITQADQETYSWRYFLWKQAIEAGHAIDLVGPFTSNYGGNPEWPKVKGKVFDQDHSSQWGWTANKMAEHLPMWLEKVDADVALIHLGTNDLLLGQGAGSTVKDLSDIIGVLRKDNPKMRILVAQIIPSASSRDFTGFNQALIAAGKEWSTPESPVEIVDCFTGFDVNDWTYDGLHPLWAGEEFIAKRFAEVLWKKK